MTKEQYAQLKEEARKRYQADLDAIKRVWELSAGKPSTSSDGSSRIEDTGIPAPVQNGRKSDPESLSGMVRAIIKTRSEPFTTKDIQEEIAVKYPQAEIANKRIYLGVLLRRLVKKREVKIEREHTATTPAQYRKA